MTINILKKIAILIVGLLTITSCEQSSEDSLVQICNSNSEICIDLDKTNLCRYERSSLIRARYYDKIDPTNEHTIGLLEELSSYESCLELTLLMQSTKDRGRKQNRIENYFTVRELIKDKLKAIKNTQDPHIAYYLWTNFQDLQAKAVFLQAAKQKDTKDSKLLIKLATIYAQDLPQYSLNLFYKALRESHSMEDIPENTFTIILTIFYQNKKFEDAYIWALLANKVNTKEELPINFDLILQKGLRNNKKLILNEDVLQKTANTYYTLLKKGEFKAQAPQLLM